MPNYNLHLHTHWSYDGEIYPETYLKRATELEMRCIAFTDHDNIDVVHDLKRLTPQYPRVQAILGAEFNVDSPIGAHHILAYGINHPFSPSLDKLLAKYRERYHQQAACLCQCIQAHGFDFSEDDLKALQLSLRPKHVVSKQGLTPVARTGLKAYCVKRAFLKEEEDISKLIGWELIPPMPLPTMDQVIPVLKENGALVVAAHPTVFWGPEGRVIVDCTTRHLDALFETFQIDGVECVHMPPDQRQICRDYCIRNGLFSVAGTDTHRIVSDFDISNYSADENWLDEFLERL